MRRVVLCAAALAALVLPVAASAHPLGNFTVNRFSRIEVAGPRVYVHYVLDLAEIPTFQAGKIDARSYARRIARGAQLTVNGRRAQLVPVETALAHPAGAGGLKTTRFEVVLQGPKLTGASRVTYRDENYAGRIGWKEILVGNAPSSSDELRAYPKDLLSSPLAVTAVQTRLVPGTVPGTRPHVTHGTALQARDRIADSRFAALVGRDHLGAWVILASLGAALFWGMAHALSPGHGKTIVTAYLVGQRGTPRHAALLGLIVTVTHTIGVFTLGLITLAALALHRSRPAVPVAQPRLRAARRRDRRFGSEGALAAQARTRARARSPSSPRPRGRPQPPFPLRRRRLRRTAPMPLRTRRPARRDLACTGWRSACC